MAKAEFVCNLPGEPPLHDQEWVGTLANGDVERVFVEAGEDWPRVGDNVIGPAYGNNPVPGDVGVYRLLEGE